MTSHPKVASQNNTCMHTLNEVLGRALGLIIYDIFHSFLCGCLLHWRFPWVETLVCIY